MVEQQWGATANMQYATPSFIPQLPNQDNIRETLRRILNYRVRRPRRPYRHRTGNAANVAGPATLSSERRHTNPERVGRCARRLDTRQLATSHARRARAGLAPPPRRARRRCSAPAHSAQSSKAVLSSMEPCPPASPRLTHRSARSSAQVNCAARKDELDLGPFNSSMYHISPNVSGRVPELASQTTGATRSSAAAASSPSVPKLPRRLCNAASARRWRRWRVL